MGDVSLPPRLPQDSYVPFRPQEQPVPFLAKSNSSLPRILELALQQIDIDAVVPDSLSAQEGIVWVKKEHEALDGLDDAIEHLVHESCTLEERDGLFASIHHLEELLEQQSEDLNSKSSQLTSAAKSLMDREQNAVKRLKELQQWLPDWMEVQDKFLRLSEDIDKSLVAWHEQRTSAPGERTALIDLSLSSLKEASSAVVALKTLATEGSQHLPVSLRTLLLQKIGECLKLLVSAEEELRNEALPSLTEELSKAVEEAADATRALDLIGSVSEGVSASQRWHESQARLAFSKRMVSDVTQHLEELHQAMTALPFTPPKPSGWRGAIDVFRHPVSTWQPTPEQQLREQESRCFGAYEALRNSFGEDVAVLQGIVKATASPLPASGSVRRLLQQLAPIDPGYQALGAILKQPFQGGVTFSPDRPEEFVEAQRAFAFLLVFEADLPPEAPQNLRSDVLEAKEKALKAFSGHSLPNNAEEIYEHLAAQERALTLQEQVALWKKHEIKLMKEFADGSSEARATALWRYLFIPLQLGAWAYGFMQMLDQGAFIKAQSMQASWERDLRDRGFEESLPEEFRGQPLLLRAWIGSLHRQLALLDDLEFDLQLSKMPPNRELRQMVIDWRARVLNDVTQLEKHTADPRFSTTLARAAEAPQALSALEPETMVANVTAAVPSGVTPEPAAPAPEQLWPPSAHEVHRVEENPEVAESAQATNSFFVTRLAHGLWSWWTSPSQASLEAFRQEVEVYHRDVMLLQEGVLRHQEIFHFSEQSLAALQESSRQADALVVRVKALSSLEGTPQAEELSAIRMSLLSSKTAFEERQSALTRQVLPSLESLVDRPPLEVEDRLLQHVLVSRSEAGVSTGFEGYSALSMLQHYLSVLSRKADSLEHNPLCEDPQRRQFCELLVGAPLGLTMEQTKTVFHSLQQGLTTALAIEQAKQGSLEEFRAAIQTTASSLQPGESFYFPGGWSFKGVEGGHALWLEVVRQNNGLFTFRVYNRGQGSEFYDCARIQGQRHCLPFTEIVDVPLNNLLGSPFLRSLQEMRRPPLEGGDWHPIEFYHKALGWLGGRQSSAYYSLNQAMESVRVGHCTFLSLDALVSQHLGTREVHDRWQLEYEFATVWDYYRERRDKGSLEIASLALLEMAVPQFARDVQSAFQQGLLLGEELAYLQTHVSELQQFVRMQRTLANVEAVKAATRPEVVPTPVPEWNVNVPTTLLDTALLPSSPRTAYEPVATQDWQFSPATFSGDLRQMLSKITQAKAIGDHLVVKEGIREFVAKVPLDWMSQPPETWGLADTAFFHDLKPDEAREVLGAFASLSQEFLASVMETSLQDSWRRFRMAPQDLLTQVKILTLTDALSSRFAEDFGFPLSVNLLESELWNFLDGTRPYFDLRNSPRAMEELGFLKAYWNQKFPEKPTGESFFRFERFQHKPYARGVVEAEYKIGEEAEHTDVVFAKQWLQRNPEALDRIEIFLESEGILSPSLAESAYVLLADMGTKEEWRNFEDVVEIAKNPLLASCRLPEPFYQIRQIALQTHLLMSGSNFGRDATALVRVIVDFPRNDFARRHRLPNMFLPLPGDVAEYDSESKDYPSKKLRSVVRPMKESLHGVFEEGVESRYDKGYFHLSGDLRQRYRRFPHQRLLASSQSVGSSKELTPLEIQELLAPNSVPSLQVREALSYFMRQPALLHKVDYQTYLETLLLEKDFLLQEFLNDPREAAELARQVADFFKEQIHFYEQLDDFGTINFFLRMNERVARVWDYAQGTRQEAETTSSPFLSSREVWTRWLQNPLLSLERRSVCLGQMAISCGYDATLTEATAVDLLSAQILFSWHGLVSEDPQWSGEQEEERRDVLIRQRAALQEVLALPQQRQAILNGVLQKVSFGAAEEVWSGDYPVFHTKDGSIAIDVLEGQLVFQGQPMKYLPREVRENSVTIDLFGLQPRAAVEIAAGLWEMKGEDGRRYRLKMQNKQLEVFRSLDDGKEWQRYHSPDELSSFPLRRWVQQCRAWSTQSTVESKCQMFFEDRDSKVNVAVASATRLENALHLEKIAQCDEKGVPNGLLLRQVTEQDPIYGFLTSIEDTRWIEVWQREDSHEPFSIRLPRYDLSFKATRESGDVRFHCDQYPGYRLARVQTHPDLLGVTSMLVLEKESSGEKLLLLPDLPLQTTDLSGATRLYIPGASVEKLRTIVVGEETLPLEERRTLKASTTEGCLKLTELLLWRRQYRQALQFLQGGEARDDYSFRSGEQLRPFDRRELEIFRTILGMSSRNGDESPEAIAVRLRAAIILIKNGQESVVHESPMVGEGVSIADRVFHDYNAFLQHRRQGPDPFASAKEEKWFIDCAFGASARRGIDLPWNRLWGREKIDPSLVEARYRELWDLPPKEQEPHLQAAAVPTLPMRRSLEVPYYFDGSATDFEDQRSDSANQEQIIGQFTSVLRPRVFSQFMTSYKDLKQQTKSSLEAVYRRWIGLEPEPSWGVADLRLHLDRVLRTALVTSGDEQEAVKIILFLAVLRAPRGATIPETTEDYQKEYQRARSTLFDEGSRYRLEDVTIVASAKSQVTKSTMPEVTLRPPAEEILGVLPTPPSMQVSMELSLPASLQEPLVPRPNAYVTVSQKTGLPRASGASLMTVLSTPLNDPLSGENAKALRQDFEKLQKLQKPRLTYSVTEGNLRDLTALRASLFSKTLDQQAELLEAAERLVALANKRPAGPEAAAYREISLATTLEEPFTIQELIHLAPTRDMALYHRRNPVLTSEDIFALYQGLVAYQVTYTQWQQTQRVLSAIDAVEEAVGRAPQAEQEALVEKLFREMSAERSYSVVEHPEWLNLEISLNGYLREDQLHNLDLLRRSVSVPGSSRRRGIGLEAPTGSGKTAVYLAKQAQLDADGEHLAWVVLPEKLLPSQAAELRERLGRAYAQLVEVLDVDRDSDFSANSLERRLNGLEDMISERKVLFMTDSSVQSLFLKFIEKALSAPSDKEVKAWTREISLFREIWRLFRASGIVTIDEVDFILNPRKAHIFTFGEESPLPQELFSTVTDLYRFLVTSPELAAQIDFSFARVKHGHPFTPEGFAARGRPLIIESILAGQVVQEKETATFLKQAGERERDLLRHYLSNIRDQEAERFVAAQSLVVRNALAVLKEELTTLLPLTEKKQVNEHYGPLPAGEGTAKSRLFAVPFHGNNNALVRSVFGTPEEIVNYTIDMYLALGVSEGILQKELDWLREQALAEVHSRRVTRIEDSKAFQAFFKLAGNDQLQLFALTPEQVKALLITVNGNPDSILLLVQRHVLPQLTVQLQQLFTSGHLYAAIVHMAKGFSATMRNERALPALFFQIVSSPETLTALRLLWEKSASLEVIHAEGDLHRLVRSLYPSDKAFQGAFIDGGGLFHGIPNERVADEIASLEVFEGGDIQGVVYYDEEDNKRVRLRGPEGMRKSVPYEGCGLTKEQLVVYWDQIHTRGSDIPLGVLTKAKASFSQHTTLPDLVQQIGRMRQLAIGQSIDFVITDEDEIIIKSVLQQATGESPERLEFRDLLLYAVYQEAQRQGDDNYRSLQQRWSSVLVERVLDAITDPSVSTEQTIELIRAVKDLWVRTTSVNPWDRYGLPTEEAPSREVVESQLEDFLASAPVQAFFSHPLLKSRYEASAMVAELRQITEESLPFLPSHLHRGSERLEKEVEVEKMKEERKEKETEQQQELLRQVELYGYDARYTEPLPFISWSTEQLFAASTYEPVDAKRLTAKKLSSRPSRVVDVSQVYAADDRVKDFSTIFDLDASVNFVPGYVRENDRQPPCTPFGGAYEDIASHYLVVQDTGSGQAEKLRLVQVDQAEAEKIKKLLQQEAVEPWRGQRQRRVALYSLDTGIEQQGSDRFDLEQLKHHAQFQRLRVQAKFRRGDQRYTPEELVILRVWMQEKGVALMKQFFERTSHETLNPSSSLGLLFEELAS